MVGAIIVATLVIVVAVIVGAFILRDSGPSPEEAVVADARKLMNDGKFSEARAMIGKFTAESGETASLKSILDLIEVREREAAAARRQDDARARLDRAIADANDYLKKGSSADARARIARFVKDHGDAPELTDLLAQIADREFREIEEEASRMIAQGRPERGKQSLEGFTPSAGHKKRHSELLEQCTLYLAARKHVEEADGKTALERIEQAFGRTDPGDDVKALRAQAHAIVRARELLSSSDMETSGSAVINLLATAFGEAFTLKGPRALLEDAIRLDVLQTARKEGEEKALEQHAGHRARFAVRALTKAELDDIGLEGIWWYSTTEAGRNDFSRPGWSVAWRRILELRRGNMKNADFLFRLAEVEFLMAEQLGLVAFGDYDYFLAINLDPSLIEKHPRIYDRMMAFLPYEPNLEWDFRSIIKKYYYKKAKPALVAALTATRETSEGIKPELEARMNAFSMLADMGDASELKDRLDFLKTCHALFWNYEQVKTPQGEFVHKPRYDATHMRALFTATMTADEYGDFRRFLDTIKGDISQRTGPFGAYKHGAEVIDNLLKELNEAQPEHASSWK
jgi:hypothetical protein